MNMLILSIGVCDVCEAQNLFQNKEKIIVIDILKCVCDVVIALLVVILGIY